MSTIPPAPDTGETDIAAAALWFSEARIENGHIALRCARDLPPGRAVHAIVGGIRIGTHDNLAGAAAGESLKLICGYYPNKGLPNEIRFALDGEDGDAAPAIALTSIGQVVALVGYDLLAEGTLRVADGALRGTAINRSNAHRKFQPPLICRVNGQAIRDVSLDAVTPHPGGGAWISFSVPIQPTDIFDSGAQYEILALPNMSLVAAKTFAPISDGSGQEARLAAVEAEIAQLARRVTHEMTATRTATGEMQQKQLRLIDSFAEYMLSVIFDRLGTGSATSPGSAEEDAAILAFRQLVSESADETRRTAPVASTTLTPPDIAGNRGWFAVDNRKKGRSFLWMGRSGSFLNPYPETPVTLISVAVQSAVSPDVLPVTVLFDGEMAEVEVLPDPDTRPFRLNLRPRGGTAKPVHTIQLLPRRSLSPKEVGTSEDARQLTIAVNSISIHYDIETRASVAASDGAGE